jgi:hypothetical protein
MGSQHAPHVFVCNTSRHEVRNREVMFRKPIISRDHSILYPVSDAQPPFSFIRRVVWQVGFVVDEVASGQVFSKYVYFGFRCQNHSFLQLLPLGKGLMSRHLKEQRAFRVSKLAQRNKKKNQNKSCVRSGFNLPSPRAIAS